MTTSASAASRWGAESNPACSGWSWGKFTWVWKWSTRGSAATSASLTMASTARGARPSALAVTLAEHLARERQVHGALRLGLGDREGAVHDRLELGEVPQLVVPLDELAHD